MSKFTKSSGLLGTNATYAVDEKGICTITIDLTQRLGDSASGKTIIVGTTSGNKEIPGTGVTVGLNAYVKKPKD